MKNVVLASVFLCGACLMSPVMGQAETLPKEASVNLVENTDDPNLLQLTEVSDLNFGSKSIDIEDMIFTNEATPKIAITDIRGEAPGWSVKVSLGEFVDDSNSRTLKGVKLFYPTVTLTTNGSIDVSERTPETTATDSGLISNTVKGLTLDSSQTATSRVLINALSGKGNGKWTATYDASHKVELLVPSGNLAGAYQADLIYTLSDEPTP